MESNYFNTNQVLEMVLRDGSDLEEEESVEEDFDDLGSESDWSHCCFQSFQPLPPCDRSSLLGEEARAKFCFIS